MLKRIATGLVLAPLVVALLLLGPPWAVALLIILVAGLCLGELYTMAMPERTVERLLGVALGAGILTLLHVGGLRYGPLTLALAIAVPVFAVLARPRPIERAAHRMLTLWGGTVYIGGTFAFGLLLATAPPDGPKHLLLACIVVFLGDTGAYFVGRAIGRHKLYEVISPKKTIEGAVGGLAASIGGAFVAKLWLLPDLDPLLCVALGAGGGAIAQVGDLAESTLKRACGVKDSGRLLPGHGGMLDRVDGLILALPYFALILAP